MVFNIVENAFKKMGAYDDFMDEFATGLNDAADHAKALAKSGLSEAMYKYIDDLKVSSAAQMTFGQKCKLVTIALKEQAVAIWASPIGKAAIIAAGVFALVKVIDHFYVSLEESREKLAELKEEYNSNESELATLNDELQTTIDRIEELQGKDSPTFTEAEELRNLQRQNAELERRIALLDTIQSKEMVDIYKTFIDVMEKDVNDVYDKKYALNIPLSGTSYDEMASENYQPSKDALVPAWDGNSSYTTISEQEYINAVLMRRNEIVEALSGELTEEERKQLNSLLKEIDGYLVGKSKEFSTASEGISYIDNPTTEDEKAVNEWLSFIDDFNDKMMISMGTDGAKENAVNRLIHGEYSEITKDLQELGEQGSVTADHLADPKYDDFINKCIELGIISDDGTDSLAFLALAFNSVASAADGAGNSTQSAAEQLQTEIDTINDGIDSVQSKLSTLSGALTKLEDGSLGVNDVIDLLQQFPELAPYVDLTADGFGNLEQGLRDLVKASPDELIKSLKEFKETEDLTEEQKNQIDNLCVALSNLPTDAIKDVTGEFGVLAEQIKAATKAQTELEKKLAEEDYDEGYEGRVEAYGSFQEVLDAGEYGSKAYSAYKDYFGLMEKTPEQIKAWMESNEKYFTEGTDGVLAFLETVESLSGTGGALDGIASFDSESGEFWYDINKLGDFADALGWTEEMLQDFINKYRMYCEEWESRSPADTMKELTNTGLISQIGNVDFGPTFASLSKLEEYTGLGEQGIYDLIDSINELRAQEGLPNISLIGRDITEVTQESITRWQNLGATAEEVSALLIELAQQDIKISPNLYIDTESGTQIDVDKLLAEAGIEDSETVQIEVDFTCNGDAAMATVQATVAEVKKILGEDWEAKLTVNSVDAETGLTTVQRLLSELPDNTDVLLLDKTGLARSSLSEVINLLDTIENNKTKIVTIRYQTIGMPTFAEGTSGAKAGPALLGDEHSPNGSPKPELVVSGDHAYLAGQHGPEIGYLNDGDIVYTADETKHILRGTKLSGSIPAHAGGTAGGLKDTGGFKSGGGYNFSSGSGSNSGSSSSESNSNEEEEESWFEKQYKYHQHLLEMDQENVEDYLKWLDDAYQRAYDDGVIDLDEFYKYQEEVYNGLQDLFKDYLNDVDHEISMLEGAVGSSDEVITLAKQAMSSIEKELAAARAAGLDENNEYIQYLEQQWLEYSEKVVSLREKAETEAKNSVDELVEYRIDMLKQEIEDEKETLNKKLDNLQEFYDKQREMLQDQYDEEKYLEEQSEKRKAVSDIDAELTMLEHDDSAWAQKRKLELQEERANADKELSDFEKDHALDMALDMLDEQQAAQEAQIQAEMDALDERLNDPHALFNQALEDIRNNTQELYDEFIAYNRQHGSGDDEDIWSLWREAYLADLEYQGTHNGEHMGGIGIGNYTGYVPPEPPAPPGSGNGSASAGGGASGEAGGSSAPKLTDEIKKKVAAAIWNGGYGWGTGSTRASRLTEVFGAGNGIQDLVNNGVGKNGVSLTDEYTYANMRKKFKGYASGTKHALPGLHEVDELGTEYLFVSPSDGTRYRMFTGGEKVLNAAATDFLYNFANSGGAVLTKMFTDLFKQTNFGNIQKPTQIVQLSSGDIYISGNATERTVSEIRRAQRSNLEYVIKEFNKLNK